MEKHTNRNISVLSVLNHVMHRCLCLCFFTCKEIARVGFEGQELNSELVVKMKIA